MPIARKQQDKERRRQTIIDAAEKLFFSKGYDNVSMNDIAKGVKVSKGTLYVYFKNKEELFFAIVLRGIIILTTSIKDEMRKKETGIEKIIGFRKAYYDFANEYPDYLRIYNSFQSDRFDLTSIVNITYMKKAIEEGRQYSMFPVTFESVSDYLKEITDLRREMINILSNAIETGIQDGTVRSDINTLQMAILLTLLTQNIQEMPYDYKQLLDVKGINNEEFTRNIDDFIINMFTNRDH